MKMILVDDDPLGLQGFEIECGKLPHLEVAGKFTAAHDALAYAALHTVDVALVDIDMPEMSGFELYDALKQQRPEIIVVFVTSYAGLAAQALKKKADYVVFKPYDKTDIQDIIGRINIFRMRLEKAVYCRTFGRFDVFIKAQPVVFTSAKAKEIFALCVYRQGAPVTAEEIIDKLWPAYTGSTGECSVFRFTVKQLVDTLKKYEAHEAFQRDRGLCSVSLQHVDCDYYRFLHHDTGAVAEFQGVFMEEYSWAEAGCCSLQEKKHSHLCLP